MTYTIQFQTLPSEPRPDVLVVKAEVIPRIGESVELDGECFTVLAVFHSAERIEFSVEMPPPAMYDASKERVVVRVK